MRFFLWLLPITCHCLDCFWCFTDTLRNRFAFFLLSKRWRRKKNGCALPLYHAFQYHVNLSHFYRLISLDRVFSFFNVVPAWLPFTCEIIICNRFFIFTFLSVSFTTCYISLLCLHPFSLCVFFCCCFLVSWAVLCSQFFDMKHLLNDVSNR